MNEITLIAVCIGSAIITGIISGSITAAIVAKRKTYKRINKIIKKAGIIKNYSEIGKLIASQVDNNIEQHEQMGKEINLLNWESRKNIKKTGHIRYNASSDISGNLSFSMAMLTDENNGIILTNIHMMEGSALYLREITAGECEITISEEEKQLLKRVIKT